MATTTLSYDDQQLAELAARVGKHLLVARRQLVTAESCTGGWIGKAMTDIPGSSAWYLGGAVVYSNALKQAVVGVGSDVIATNGAVSEAVVRAMAEGALERLGGDIGVAVSGVAGPDGGTKDKPVGTVWFAWSKRTGGVVESVAEKRNFSGNRDEVRRQTVYRSLERLLEL